MEKQNVRYVSDDKGDITDVIVPIDLWRKIETHQDETEYLLSSEPMKNRLLESIRRNEDISLEDARDRGTPIGLPANRSEGQNPSLSVPLLGPVDIR